MAQYQVVVDKAVEFGRNEGDVEYFQVNAAPTASLLLSGVDFIPVGVLVEIDTFQRFHKDKTVVRPYPIVRLHADTGVYPSRIVFRSDSIRKRIRPSEQLKNRDIRRNLTLLFGFDQAVVCADTDRYIYKSVCWTNRQLIQRGCSRGGQTHNCFRHSHLQLIQEARISKESDGCEFPQKATDHSTS